MPLRSNVSPSKHVVKLPYWSSEWYCWYRREVAHHLYVFYINSLISCLSLLVMPHFRLEVLNTMHLCTCGCVCPHVLMFVLSLDYLVDYPFSFGSTYLTVLLHLLDSYC